MEAEIQYWWDCCLNGDLVQDGGVCGSGSRGRLNAWGGSCELVGGNLGGTSKVLGKEKEKYLVLGSWWSERWWWDMCLGSKLPPVKRGEFAWE